MLSKVTVYEWNCDYKGCKAHTTSYEVLDTPYGWTRITGAMQLPSGGGPASFELCPKHSATFHNKFNVNDTDGPED